MATTIELLRKARALINKPGKWCKDSLWRESKTGKDQYCIMGALNKAASGNEYKCSGHEKVDEALHNNLSKHFKKCADSWIACVNFNNSRGTTHKMLLAWIDRTIKGLRKKSRP